MGNIDLEYRTVYDLRGGMATQINFAKMPDNAVRLVLNGDLSLDGSIETRGGRSKLTLSPLPGNPTVHSLSILGQIGNRDLIFATGDDTMYEVSTGNNIVVKSGLSVGNKVQSVQLNNFLFNVNGVDLPWMTQGSSGTTYQVGIQPPTSLSGMTVSPTGAGSATAGTHRVTFRYRSTITGARSLPPISSNTIQSVTVTMAGSDKYSIDFPAGLVSPDSQVDQIDFFVQEAGAIVEQPYYYLGSTGNVSGVTSFDASDDTLIVREILDVDDDFFPTTCRDIETWRGRLLCITDDYEIRYSKQKIDVNGFVNLPTSLPAVNSLLVGYGDGDPLKKIIRYDDIVFAFKERSVWVLTGNFGSSNFQFVRLKTNYPNIGLLNPRCIAEAGERLYFITDELKLFSFGKTDFNSTELRLDAVPISWPVGDVFETFAVNFRQNINITNFTFGQRTQIFISFSNGLTGLASDQNFNIFVYDYIAKAWHIHTNMEVASSVLAKDDKNNYRVFIGDYFGLVWETDVPGSFDGAQINGTSTGGNTINTFNDTTKNFDSSLIGTLITIVDGTGKNQIKRIVGVPSSTQLTIAPDWVVIPGNTSEYTIGGFDFKIWSNEDMLQHQSPPDFDKTVWYFDIDYETRGDYGISVQFLKDRNKTFTGSITKELIRPGAFWGSAIWGIDVWGDSNKLFGQLGLDLGILKQVQHRIENRLAGQWVRVNGWTYTYQSLHHVRA